MSSEHHPCGAQVGSHHLLTPIDRATAKWSNPRRPDRDGPVCIQGGQAADTRIEERAPPETRKSECPGKLAVGRSWPVALERTATSVSGPYSVHRVA